MHGTYALGQLMRPACSDVECVDRKLLAFVLHLLRTVCCAQRGMHRCRVCATIGTILATLIALHHVCTQSASMLVSTFPRRCYTAN